MELANGFKPGGNSLSSETADIKSPCPKNW